MTEKIEQLQAQGIGRLFGPGTPTSELIDGVEHQNHLTLSFC